MSKQNPGILFIGSSEKAHAVEKNLRRANEGWMVYHASETMEALSQYIFTFPDIVVIDQADYPITATEVSFHLHSLMDDTPIFIVNEPDIPALVTLIEATVDETLLPQT
jgi:hypothetical protein